MLKRVLVILLVLMCLCTTCVAAKQEWKNKKYDFSNAKKLCIVLTGTLKNENTISTYEIDEVYDEKVEKFLKAMRAKNYIIYRWSDIENEVNKTYNINWEELYKVNKNKAMALSDGWIANNIDIYIKIDLKMYDIGTQYCEGFFYNMPTTETTTISTPYGNAYATTNKNQMNYVSGGNFPTAYCVVGMELFDINSNKLVWARNDDRAKVNRTVFENTTPKDIFKRILNDMFNDINNTFKSKNQ